MSNAHFAATIAGEHYLQNVPGIVRCWISPRWQAIFA
jgi:hypothetical protein